MQSKVRGGLALALLVLGLALPSRAGALPAPIVCGSVVTKSVTLQADLANCTGDGLIVGAAGIRIDLNGHAITSPAVNSSTVPVTPGSAGIRNPGYPRVRIEDTQSSTPVPGGVGWIAGFAVGILITDASRNTIVNLTDYDGLRLERSHNATIRNNQLSSTLGCDPSTNTAGLHLVDSNRATIRGNESQLGGLGMVLVRSHNNVLQGNGVTSPGSDGNDCSGIVLLDADGNQLLGNTTNENRGDGLFIDAVSQRTVIDGHYATFNSDDGIDIENRTTTVRNTNSTNNGDFGIEAIPGVTASGNTASYNTNPLQCLNIMCT